MKPPSFDSLELAEVGGKTVPVYANRVYYVHPTKGWRSYAKRRI
jgi:hypothetical protein